MSLIIATLMLAAPLLAIGYEIASGVNRIVAALNAIEARLREGVEIQ